MPTYPADSPDNPSLSLQDIVATGPLSVWVYDPLRPEFEPYELTFDLVIAVYDMNALLTYQANGFGFYEHQPLTSTTPEPPPEPPAPLLPSDQDVYRNSSTPTKLAMGTAATVSDGRGTIFIVGRIYRTRISTSGIYKSLSVRELKGDTLKYGYYGKLISRNIQRDDQGNEYFIDGDLPTDPTYRSNNPTAED